MGSIRRGRKRKERNQKKDKVEPDTVDLYRDKLAVRLRRIRERKLERCDWLAEGHEKEQT